MITNPIRLDVLESNYEKIENRIPNVLKKPWYNLIFQLQSTIIYATFDFFKEKQFSPALLPITTGAVTSPMGLGSDSIPVNVNLFGLPTYLADSMQFHLEYLLRIADRGVYYIMPTFRGEDPDERHLNQFFHIEAEIKGNLDNVTSLIDEYLRYILQSVIYSHGVAIEKHAGSLNHLNNFLKKESSEKITFIDAVKLLGANNIQYFQYAGSELIGLSNLGEKMLLKRLGDGIWLSHLPKAGVPFYQQDSEDGVHALCADYLAGIGEIIGCGQRHTCHINTKLAMTEREVNPNNYQWYLQLKKEYPMQTSGFGLGMERLLLWILKHHDIRDIPIISRLKGIHSVP